MPINRLLKFDSSATHRCIHESDELENNFSEYNRSPERICKECFYYIYYYYSAGILSKLGKFSE